MRKVSFLFFVLALVTMLVLSLAPVALASGYLEPKAGENPHGNYSDTGNKCKVCHAVHNAKPSPGQTLLRSSRNDACTYCHIDGGFSIKTPYGTTATNYTDEKDWNHDDNHNSYTGSTLYAGCVSCHSVHGANTFGGASKILKDDPGKAIATPVTTEIDFCRDCHNSSGGNVASGGCFNLCHTAGSLIAMSPEYYLKSRDGVTHIMTTTLTGNYSTSVAWVSSETCRKCHAAGQPYANGDSYPHYTPSAVQFLDDGYTEQDTNLDLVCMNCHTNTGNGSSYTSGVGKTF